MAKTSGTKVQIRNWCDKSLQYASAKDAIFAIDMAAPQQSNPVDHLQISWTAITVWLEAKGSIIAPEWLGHVARFHRLTRVDLIRVRDAIEMRLRAFERLAIEG